MPVDQLPAQAPKFTLEHVLGHAVSLDDYQGRTVVAMFGAKDSAEQVKQSVETIRDRYDPDELAILAVSDLESVPRPARIIAKTQLKKAFRSAAEDQSARMAAAGKQAPEDPAKTVVMLMDWKGDVVRGFGLSRVDEEAVGVVIDGDGRIVGSGAGAQAGEQILALLSSR
jgi:peroxiredoxin